MFGGKSFKHSFGHTRIHVFENSPLALLWINLYVLAHWWSCCVWVIAERRTPTAPVDFAASICNSMLVYSYVLVWNKHTYKYCRKTSFCLQARLCWFEWFLIPNTSPQGIWSCRKQFEVWSLGVSINILTMYLSLIPSHDDRQFEIYKCTKSVGKSTAVVKRLTTSICKSVSCIYMHVRILYTYIYNCSQCLNHLGCCMCHSATTSREHGHFTVMQPRTIIVAMNGSLWVLCPSIIHVYLNILWYLIQGFLFTAFSFHEYFNLDNHFEHCTWRCLPSAVTWAC